MFSCIYTIFLSENLKKEIKRRYYIPYKGSLLVKDACIYADISHHGFSYFGGYSLHVRGKKTRGFILISGLNRAEKRARPSNHDLLPFVPRNYVVKSRDHY